MLENILRPIITIVGIIINIPFILLEVIFKIITLLLLPIILIIIAIFYPLLRRTSKPFAALITVYNYATKWKYGFKLNTYKYWKP